MARDFDKEIQELLERVSSLKKAKKQAEEKRYNVIGQAAVEVFGDELNDISSLKNAKKFFSELKNKGFKLIADEPVNSNEIDSI